MVARISLPSQHAVSVIIPTCNTARALPAMLDGLVRHTGGAVAEVVVIDDASTDGTPDKVRALKAADPLMDATVRLLESPASLGYGASVKRGFKELVTTAPFIAVVQVRQREAAATLLDMASAFALDPAPDVVLASRFLDGAITDDSTFARRTVDRVFTGVTRMLSGLRMSDAGTPIMLARAGALDRMPFTQLANGHQFHAQLNLMLYGDPELVVAEVPLRWRDAKAGVRSSLTGYALALTRMLLTFAWHRRVRRRRIGDAVVAASRRDNRSLATTFAARSGMS